MSPLFGRKRYVIVRHAAFAYGLNNKFIADAVICRCFILLLVEESILHSLSQQIVYQNLMAELVKSVESLSISDLSFSPGVVQLLYNSIPFSNFSNYRLKV